MSTPRVYADANLPSGVVMYMRRALHWDVLFVLEDPSLRRASDREHFRLARELGRTLITLDHDFCDDRRFPPSESPGVVVCAAPGERALKRLLADLHRTVFQSSAGEDPPLEGHKMEMAPGLWREV